MSDEFTTHYVKGGFATADEVVLAVTSTTRTVFRPGIHDGGVRGHVIRQKKSDGGVWKDTNEVNFNQMPADCGVSIELDTAATTKLFEKLTQLYDVAKDGVSYGEQEYVVAKKDQVVITDDPTKVKVIEELLEQGHSEDFWQKLVETDPDLATRLAAGQLHVNRVAAIEEFAANLDREEGNEGYWQDLFEREPWMLQAAFSANVFYLRGETYVGGKAPLGRQGAGGVATDFLFGDESTKSFAVIDIKTPGTPLAGSQYRGSDESGSNVVFSMSPALSGSVVQVRNQMAVAVDHFESVLGPGLEHQINRVHPKGVLIAGRLDRLGEKERESFNHFRQGLFSLSVITYDELLRRLAVLYDVDLGDDSSKADPF